MVTGSDAGLQQETKVRRGLLPADISKAAHGFTCPRKRNKSSRRIASSRDDGIVVVAARPRRNHGDAPLLRRDSHVLDFGHHDKSHTRYSSGSEGPWLLRQRRRE
jgi:hypothetical protein